MAIPILVCNGYAIAGGWCIVINSGWGHSRFRMVKILLDEKGWVEAEDVGLLDAGMIHGWCGAMSVG